MMKTSEVTMTVRMSHTSIKDHFKNAGFLRSFKHGHLSILSQTVKKTIVETFLAVSFNQSFFALSL